MCTRSSGSASLLEGMKGSYTSRTERTRCRRWLSRAQRTTRLEAELGLFCSRTVQSPMPSKRARWWRPRVRMRTFDLGLAFSRKRWTESFFDQVGKGLYASETQWTNTGHVAQTEWMTGTRSSSTDQKSSNGIPPRMNAGLYMNWLQSWNWEGSQSAVITANAMK